MDGEATSTIGESKVRTPDYELVAGALLKLAPTPRTQRWGICPWH